MTTISPADFMAAAPAPLGGNTPWAARYAAELRRVATEHAARAPRSLQLHLGPSELGSPCDRQVAGKMAGLPVTNHVSDPWPSIVGTAVHAWLAEAFTADNVRKGMARWLAEVRVTPHPNHPGTADLYDAVEQSVDDHKVLGETSMQKVRSAEGPPRKYVAQLGLYGLGYLRLGLPVKRIVLIAWPRTKSSLDQLYVWERLFDGELVELLAEVWTDTARRQEQAKALHAGHIQLRDIPATPTSDECFFCPFYRPESSRESSVTGCPGSVNPQ
ncbi:hypothetical protein [Labedaea rhizosphaerae]|uniref:PD-(D/E)XK nuclease superfamily protein n=1 Tax=Labedaea rhizosphaerae TaxID=598644 RepID=A0A4R6SDD3_LABRH|nr:hypothetical protein [Labedaea rhizosphaerae]TDP97667.1 hypothetical protein EV186_103631 [Labedaea rhizosphaerae]